MAAVFLSFAPSQLDLDPRYIVSEEKGAQSTTPQLHLSTSRREAALLIKPTESRWSERVSGLTLSATLDNSEQCAPLEPMKALTVQCGGKVDDDRPPCHCRKDWDACQGSPMAKKSDDNAVVLNAELPQENNKFRLTVSWCSVTPKWSGAPAPHRSFKTELKDIKVTYKLSAEEDPSADGSDSNQNAGEMEALVAPERVTVTFARAPPPELVILSPIGDESVEPVKTCSGGRISVDAAVTALKFSVKARADPCPEVTDGNRALWGGLKMGCSLHRDAHSEKTARLKCVDEVRRRRRLHRHRHRHLHLHLIPSLHLRRSVPTPRSRSSTARPRNVKEPTARRRNVMTAGGATSPSSSSAARRRRSTRRRRPRWGG